MKFQSSPAPKSRCYVAGIQTEVTGGTGFNPHRPRRAGATQTVIKCTITSIIGFNPHRPRRAGATVTVASVGSGS